MSAIADAVCPGGVVAEVAVAPDATVGTPRVNTARTAPATRTCRLPRTPRLLRIVAAPLVGLDATGLVAAHRASRSGAGWTRGVFHRHRHAEARRRRWSGKLREPGAPRSKRSDGARSPTARP